MPIFRFLAVAVAKTFSKLFGIATISFLGRVPSRDADKIAFVGLMSLTWFALLVAAVVPPLAELLIPGLPEDEWTIRWLSIAGAVLIPLVNGVVISRCHNRDGDGARAVVRHAFAGYGYTAAIGAVVLAIVVVVPILRGAYLIRRFDVKHVAVMIPEDAYPDVLASIEEALADEGIETEVTEPHAVLRRLFAALAWLLGSIFQRGDVASDMKSISGQLPDGDDGDDSFEVILHSTDISVIGRKKATTAVAAILSERLEHPDVYFSWDDEAQDVEDRIRDLRTAVRDGGSVADDDLDDLRRDLLRVELSTEEWNAIRRLLYRLEIEVLRSAVTSNGDGTGSDGEGDDAEHAGDGTRAARVAAGD